MGDVKIKRTLFVRQRRSAEGFFYIVEKAVNMLVPTIGTMLSVEETQALINQGVNVNVSIS